MTDAPLLSVSDLEVYYGKVTAIDDISFDVADDTLVSVIGPNGAGKTSLSEAITGYKSYEGSIRFRGQEIREFAPSTLVARGMAYCTENRDLYGHLSVDDNLELGAFAQTNVAIDERREFVFDLFPQLADRRDQMARTMSGGEQQMLAIGRTLMADPDFLILDEATLGLAPVILDAISEGLEQIRDEDVTILLCEQNVTFALQHADRILLLENGTIQWDGTGDELEDNEEIQEAYLGR
ncbi:ABC transporter ATP-binding protein [Halobacterium noricense]|uniref:ABC transporter ATP-binding protein n=1 Tax=Halobacterium noricense TaxID=223182 RepID=UPI001E379629|nr:ABC transporter ATP-binding protein [Halobacterium noricense]UHH23958.1 ABC transporter ATP-binding protein [Halobacterium noricense]